MKICSRQKFSPLKRRTTGVEPVNDGATIHCRTTWLRPPKINYLQCNVFINYGEKKMI